MKEYNIAFFTADWNYELVENTLHGLYQFVQDHPGVRLRLFDCFGKEIGNARDDSEYAIYSLPDLSTFDGVLMQGNQIVFKGARKELSRRAREAGIPAVSLGCPAEGFTLICTDNRKAQRDITVHLIRDHHARKLVYLTGLLQNDCPEGQQRRDGFLDACREYGLTQEDTQIVPCSWRTSDGAHVAKTWVREGRPLPDAFVSANDEMALGMLETFQELGVRVPQDVLVTGYDNLASGELASPRLSSVSTDQQQLNYFALDRLLAMIDGTETREVIPFDYDLVCSESCGCPNQSRPGMIRDRYFQQTRFLTNFYTLQDQLAEKMFAAETLEELMKALESNQSIFGVGEIYLCLNDFYYERSLRGEIINAPASFGEEMLLTGCRRLRKQDPDFQPVRFPRRELLPRELEREEPFLIFYPIYYNHIPMGYLAMNGISTAARLNLHESILNFLEIALENLRKKGVLKKLNSILDDLHLRDALTGLYNRFGLARHGLAAFDTLLDEEGTVQILFVDMDHMKQINDQFGHDAGDRAILQTTAILREICGENSFLMRYGGDEFVGIVSSREKNLPERIEAAVNRFNRSGKEPFLLGITTGSGFSSAGEGKSLEDCVKMADNLMYGIKQQKKVYRDAVTDIHNPRWSEA